MTDCDRILTHLRENMSIATPTTCITLLTAWTEHSIYRLADTIYKLRRKGYDISTEMVRDTDRNGEPCSYARYWLHEE